MRSTRTFHLKHRTPLSRQRGVAIVMAVLVVALATIAASYIFWQQRAWADLVEGEAIRTQLKFIARGGLHWARSVLREDAIRNSVDHFDEVWTTKLPLTVIEEDIELGGTITDQQGLFNLNNVVRENGQINPRMLDVFRRLLEQLGLPSGLADALADWMDSDDVPLSGEGKEDVPYLASIHPYGAANRKLLEIDDLHFVNGFTADIIGRLVPYASVLPRQTKLNVNTAPAEVLMAYVGGLRSDEAKTLVDGRKTYFKDQLDFLSRLPRRELDLDRGYFDVNSQFFTVRVDVRRGGALLSLSALVERYAVTMPTIVREKFE